MLTLFTISGFLLATFFVARLFELKIGKQTFIGRLTTKTDGFFRACVHISVDSYKTVVAGLHRLFTHHVPSHSEKMWDGVRRFAQAKQVRARDVLRGRKILKEGAVSFFLKNISDARRKGGETGGLVG